MIHLSGGRCRYLVGSLRRFFYALFSVGYSTYTGILALAPEPPPPRTPLLLAYHQYWAVSVPYNTIRDASQERPSHPTTASAPHHYKPRVYLFG